MRRLRVLVLAVVLALTGCVNSAGHVLDQNGKPVATLSPFPVNVVAGANMTITGNVTIPNPMPVTGTVAVSSIPAVTGTVSISGNVNTTNKTQLTDSSGTALTTEENRLGVIDYYTAIAEGDVSGHTPFTQMGFNADIFTATEDIWLGSSIYIFPTVAQQMRLVSTSAQDSSAGTGIRSVTIDYLDGSYAQHSENVTLNGLTVVNTVATNIFRVNSMRANTVGNTYAAVGDIQIQNLAGTPAYRYITATYTRSRGTIYTVPAGKTLYISDWWSGISGLTGTNQIRLTIRGTYNEVTGQQLTAGLFFLPQAEILCATGSIDRVFDIPIKFPATTDIKVSGITDGSHAAVESTLRGWLESQ
jgi:hypothetical protein